MSLSQTLKSETLTPSNTKINGAEIITNFQSVNIFNNTWRSYINSQTGWQFILMLDNSWGFDPYIYSTITITINAPSITGIPTFDALIFGFATNNAQYITTLIPMDNSGPNRIYPTCLTTSTLPQMHGIGDIASLPYFHRKCDVADGSCANWGHILPINLPNQLNRFPITFELDNDPYTNILRFSFRSKSFSTTFDQHCFFKSALTNRGLKLYIGGNDIGQSFILKSIQIQSVSHNIAPTAPTPPTNIPTNAPTQSPITIKPTNMPTTSPTGFPITLNPTNIPTKHPTKRPTNIPTETPTNKPTNIPTDTPTSFPTTPNPTMNPTVSPTLLPTTFKPTNNPTHYPTKLPTDVPTTVTPTKIPSNIPTTVNPTKSPTEYPTDYPTDNPTDYPTNNPTLNPAASPTLFPTNIPSATPYNVPSTAPYTIPSIPTPEPTLEPTPKPITASPTLYPTFPSNIPTSFPTHFPTYIPTVYPTIIPTLNPSDIPSLTPTNAPSPYPTLSPTISPSLIPTSTYEPTPEPSARPIVEVTNTVSATHVPTIQPTTLTPTTLTPTRKPVLYHVVVTEQDIVYEVVVIHSTPSLRFGTKLVILLAICLTCAVLFRFGYYHCKRKVVQTGAKYKYEEPPDFMPVSSCSVMHKHLIRVHFGDIHFNYSINEVRNIGEAIGEYGAEEYQWDHNTYHELTETISNEFDLHFTRFGLYEIVDGVEEEINDIDDVIVAFDCTLNTTETHRSIDLYVHIMDDATEADCAEISTNYNYTRANSVITDTRSRTNTYRTDTRVTHTVDTKLSCSSTYGSQSVIQDTYDEMIETWKKILSTTRSPKWRHKAYKKMGLVEERRGNVKKAIRYYLGALDEKCDDDLEEKVLQLMDVGDINSSMNDPSSTTIINPFLNEATPTSISAAVPTTASSTNPFEFYS